MINAHGSYKSRPWSPRWSRRDIVVVAVLQLDQVAPPKDISKIRQTLKMWPNIIWTTTCGTLLLTSFELWPAIQQPGAPGITQVETSIKIRRGKLQVCVCVCPINTALPTVHHRMLRMCQLCKRVPMHWLRGQIIGQVFPSSICSLRTCHCWCSCETNCGAASCAELFIFLHSIWRRTTHHLSIIT